MNLKSQFKTALPLLLPAYLATAGLLGLGLLAEQLKGIPFGNFTRDPANILRMPFYTGALSNVGILLWCATAAICLFSAAVLRESLQAWGMRAFLLASGLFSGLLLFDDLFLLHEVVFPRYLHLHQNVLYAGYALMLLLCMVWFRRLILRTDFLILLCAAGLLGSGMVADLLTDQAADTSLKFLIEDGLKLFGIVSWFIYYARVSLLGVRDGLPAPATR